MVALACAGHLVAQEAMDAGKHRLAHLVQSYHSPCVHVCHEQDKHVLAGAELMDIGCPQELGILSSSTTTSGAD